MKSAVYAVVDNEDRIIKIYASHAWARKALDGFSDRRIEQYINPKDRIMVDIAHYELFRRQQFNERD